jgi:hypothetical protein
MPRPYDSTVSSLKTSVTVLDQDIGGGAAILLGNGGNGGGPDGAGGKRGLLYGTDGQNG